MKRLIFSLFAILILSQLIPVFASPLDINIPPTPAFSKATTSNQTVYSMNYSTPIHFVGLGGITITGSNNSKTIYISSTGGNGSTIHPITCSTNWQIHSVNSSGYFVCAPNNSTGIQTLNTDSNPNQIINSANTHHITVTDSTNIHSIDIAFKVNNSTCSAGYFVSSYSNVTGIYTCSQASTGITSLNGDSTPSQTVNSGQGIIVSNSGNTHTIATNFKVNNISCSTGYAITSFDNSTGVYSCQAFTQGGLTSAVTSINGQTGPSVSFVRQLGNTTITNNTNSIVIGLGINPVIIGGSAQTVTKSLTLNSGALGGDFNVGSNSLTNSGHKITLPLNSGTVKLTNTTALVNYTTPSNPATTTSTTGVMSNLFATFTPATTGKIFIQICGGMFSGTAADGAGFDIRYGTSLISEGTAIGNTKVGTEQIITASTASKAQSACSIAYVSGLTLNTKYYIQIGKFAVTGGTATFQNFETYVEEK